MSSSFLQFSDLKESALQMTNNKSRYTRIVQPTACRLVPAPEYPALATG